MPPASHAQLFARQLSRSLGGQPVLRGVSLSVGPGDRIGLLGPNGVGKSTLLRLLAGLERPDEGTVERAPSDLTVGYLDQEPTAPSGESLLTYLQRRTGVWDTAEQMRRLERTMGEELSSIERYAGALERFRALGGFDLEARAAQVCRRLGLSDGALHREVRSLSGGQRVRAALAAIALARSDVLLLDEPTNNLDLDGLDELERLVLGYSGGIVVVSHDREFLDRCVHRFVELDPFARTSTDFAGDWTEYERMRDLRRQQQLSAHEASVAERDRLTRRAHEIRAEASSGTARAKRKPTDADKYIRSARIKSAQDHGARAAGIERKLAKLEVAPKPRELWQLSIDLAPARRSGELVLRLAGAVIERGDFRLGPVELELARGDRVALTGPNGSGKTTLLMTILGALPLRAGSRRLGEGVVVGALGQDRTLFASGRPLLEMFEQESGSLAGEARSLLAKFDLGAGDVTRPGEELSPGERTRATLALLVARRTNLLVLDEPTNHLDLPAIEELERSLASYPGTFVIATHDRRLLERIEVTRSIAPDGRPGAPTRPGIT